MVSGTDVGHGGTDMTNESKVVRYEWDDLGGVHSTHPDGEWVTHANYKALEEVLAAWKGKYASVVEILNDREEELASLRERVVTLEGNIEAYKERGGVA